MFIIRPSYLLLLTLVVSIIIIINYNVDCYNIMVPNGTEMDTLRRDDAGHVVTSPTIHQVSRKTHSPLTDHTLFNIIHLLRFLNPRLLVKEYGTAMKGRASWLTCQVCTAAVGLIRLYPSLPTVQTVFVNVCSLGYEEYRVCEGLSELFGEEFIYILTHTSLSHSEVCGLVIGTSCMPSRSEYPYGEKWATPMLPLPVEVQEVLERMEQQKANDLMEMPRQNVSRILHLSDLHLDMYYQVNAPAACSEPLCCRATSTSNKRSYAAGQWGSLDNCDSVLRTIENLLATISQHHSDHYRYVLLTGDYIPHDIWNTTKQEIIHTTKTFNGLVRKHVPSDKIIIPVIGNHESHPVDQFCPSSLNKEFSSQWLYEELLNQWKDWIPQEYHETFRQNGYYSKVDGNARFIVLNMNYCARLNFWNVLKYIDMGNMLHWFQLELQNATTAGQYVYIVGHIAPDEDECSTHWIMAYRNILQVYKKIIRGQFFGHTHLDEFRIYYSNFKTNPEPVGVAYLAPSVTTYFNVYPSFRFYSTDPNSGEIMDHMTYYLNVTKANMASKQFKPYETFEPVWEFEYSARESYNLTSLSPESWHEFAKRTLKDAHLLREYYKHYGRYNDEQVDGKSIQSMLNVLDRVFVTV